MKYLLTWKHFIIEHGFIHSLLLDTDFYIQFSTKPTLYNIK